ncbi:hypothetical protein ACIP98_38205 [Streptomyces sp. NPDC088354]|uniref:hypothetical protein n=1 Tax=Streptomyces sp. NPDC088354 TaxID=3365856 RepID=UPI0038268EDE
MSALAHASEEVSGDTWPLAMIGLLTAQMYWSSAYRKLRSANFMSGDRLADYVDHSIRVEAQLPYREFFFPAWIRPLICPSSDPRVRRGWKALSVATVVVEAVLPLLLLVPDLYVPAVVLGVLMHLGFLFLEPFGLLSFGLASTSTYIFFSPALH